MPCAFLVGCRAAAQDYSLLRSSLDPPAVAVAVDVGLRHGWANSSSGPATAKAVAEAAAGAQDDDEDDEPRKLGPSRFAKGDKASFIQVGGLYSRIYLSPCVAYLYF